MRLLAEFTCKYNNYHVMRGTDLQSKVGSIYPLIYTQKKNNTAVPFMIEKCLPVPANDVGFADQSNFKKNHRDHLLNLQSKLLEFEHGVTGYGLR